MLVSKNRIRMALIASCTLLSSYSLQAEDWPTFRGANRSGVAPDKNLLESWPDEGPKLLWSADGAGRGYSSITVANGKCYTLGDGCSTAKDADEYLTCYDQKTGKQLWATKTGDAWNVGQPDWQSSRSTPTVEGGMVYVLNPKEIWSAATRIRARKFGERI